MKIKLKMLLAFSVAIAPLAHAQNIPLMANEDMNSYEGWTFGASVFDGKADSTYAGFRFAPQDFSFEERAAPEGNGVRMLSWDDEVSTRIDMYYLFDHPAGPPTSVLYAGEFVAGDVIVFKGSASSVKNDLGDQDMITQAFIKFLGYQDVGGGNVDPNQTFEELSVYHPITSDLGYFELRATYPDVIRDTPITEDNPLTRIQVGFQISTYYDADANAMDTGSIYAENFEAYIEGDEVAPTTWNGYDILENSWVDTMDWMGLVNIANDPWIYVANLEKYVYIPDNAVGEEGAWIYPAAQ